MKKNFAVFSAVILGVSMLALVAKSQTATTPAAPGAAPAAAAAEGPPPTKVGIINAAGALATTKEGQKALDELQKNVFQPKKEQLDKLQATIQSNTAKLRNGGVAMSADAQKNLQTQIDADTKTFNRTQEDAQAEVEEQQGKIMQELGSKMMTVLSTYATDNGFAVILDVSNQSTPVLWAAGGVDVTQDIIKLYDAKYPLSATAAAPAPPVQRTAAPAAKQPAAPAKK